MEGQHSEIGQKAEQEPRRLIVLGKDGVEAAAAEDTPRTIKIRDARGEETDVEFDIVGTLSQRYKKAQKRQNDRLAKNRKKMTGDDLDRRTRELTAACVVNWRGVVDQQGSPVPCTPDHVDQALIEMSWIREQVDEEAGDHEGFLTSGSRS